MNISNLISDNHSQLMVQKFQKLKSFKYRHSHSTQTSRRNNKHCHGVTSINNGFSNNRHLLR